MPLRLVLAALCLCLAAPAASATPPAWAPADRATIHPGVQMFTEGAQCTANFIFYDETSVYIGYAAHCAEDSEGPVGTANFGCDAKSHPIGTPVEIQGASSPGALAYSSYASMTAVQESESDVCGYNDFAVVRIDPSDHGRVNPTMPFWGGPTGLRQSTIEPYEKVLSVGNSGLRGGIEELGPKEGYTLGENGGGMSHELWTVTPGVFGDSGSGYIDGSGSAFGIASTISAYGSNNASDLAFGLRYMRAHTRLRLWLALGTETFSGPLAGPGLSPSPPPEPQPDPNGPGGDQTSDDPSGPSDPPPPGSSPPPGQPPAPGQPRGVAPQSSLAIDRPATRRAKLRRIRGSAANVSQLRVAVLSRRGRRCLTLGPRGRFARARNCEPRWQKPAGTTRWSVAVRGTKPRGRYLILARGLDPNGKVVSARRGARVR